MAKTRQCKKQADIDRQEVPELRSLLRANSSSARAPSSKHTNLLELKLASGMTGGVTRLKDLADVVALIQILKLNKEFANQLNPYVRDKYNELWKGVQDAPLSEP